MMRAAHRRVRVTPVCIAAMLAVGCGPVEADHPYDPATPLAEQIPARLSGRIVPVAGAVDDALAGVRVALYAGEDIGAPAHDTPVDADGRFRFDFVTPGLYRLQAASPTRATAPQVMSLPAGQTLDIGDLPLKPLTAVVTGAVWGGGAPLADARLDAGPWASLTDADGRFTLTIGVEAPAVTASATGYHPAEIPLDLAPGEVVELEPIALTARPARLDAQIVLQPYLRPAALAMARAWLEPLAEPGDLPPDAPPPDAPPPDPWANPQPSAEAIHGGVDPDGLLTIAETPPGRWQLHVVATGHAPLSRRVALDPGETADLGPLTLLHRALGGEAVWLTVQVDGPQGPLPGAAVDVEWADGAHFDRASTDAAGRAAIRAAPDEVYVVRATAPGYASSATGALTYDPASAGFTDPAGEPPRLRLEPQP